MGRHRTKLLFLGILLTCFVWQGIAAQNTSALSNTGPDGDVSPSGAVHFSVARTGANYQLDAPRTVVKIYSPTPNGTVTIIDGKYCGSNYGGIDSVDDGDGGRGVPITNFQVVRADANENMTATVEGTATNFMQPDSCTSRNLTINYSGLIRSQIQGHGNYYVGYFIAEMAVGFYVIDWSAYTADSINGFKVQMPAGGIVSFYAGSGNKFAMGELWISRNTFTDMNLQFAPPCSLAAPRTVSLDWFDADIGAGNQIGNIPTTLYRYDAITGALLGQENFDMTGGNNVPGSRSITVHPNSRYVWNVRNVYSRNGIQFQLPFDSFNFIQDCTTATCGNVQTTPATVTAGQPFNTRVGFNLTRAVLFNYSVRFVNLGGDSGNITYAGPNPIYGMSTGTAFSQTFNNMTAPTGIYYGRFELRGTTFGGATISIDCEFGNPGAFVPEFPPIQVVGRPYYRIYGGDALAGTAFLRPDGTCPLNTGARFVGFNAGNNGTNAYAGAGTQLASFALGAIVDHVSAANRSSGAMSPKGLSFANSIAADAYGGNLNDAVATCAPDYFGRRSGTALGGTINIDSTTNGTYSRTGSLVITSAAAPNVGTGRDVTIYVDGDAYITGNIAYTEPAGGYADANTIPRFMLVVRGDIFIHPSVTRIDGILIAQPQLSPADTGNPVDGTGRIVTCAYNGRANPIPTDTELISSCNQKLTITGAVLANTIKPLRTRGSLQDTTPLPAPRVELTYTYMAGYSGLNTNPNCINFREPANSHDAWFADNYLCGASTNNDLGLSYTYAAPYNAANPLPSLNGFDDSIMGPGKFCVQVNEGAEPPGFGFPNSGMFNNYVCVNEKYALATPGNYGNYRWEWRTAGAVAGKTCVPIHEPSDPNTWNDNYLCYNPTPTAAYTPPAPPVTRAAAELSGSANIAEVIIYTPEVWLTRPSGSPGYDSIISLPPVL